MLDLRKFGIKVSYIMPGSVATYFNNHKPSAEDAWKIQPQDIAQLILDCLAMNPGTLLSHGLVPSVTGLNPVTTWAATGWLPSRIEVRPSQPK